jgi:hypothetical protein
MLSSIEGLINVYGDCRIWPFNGSFNLFGANTRQSAPPNIPAIAAVGA